MDRYENLGVVGEGSYGVVLKCRHRDTGQIVAIKKFLESEDDPNVKKIALREVRMLKKLRHENLVNLIEFFRRKKRLYLVFEFVDHTILDELESSESGLRADTARCHIFQVIRGVTFCHDNQIIHRDVKPENVLVSRLGVVKLCDFGFARVLEGPNETCTDYVATRWYRAPELLVGDTKYGREVDIWAIGCLLSEILNGDPLFPGDSDIDQLYHIIQSLGSLSSSHQELVSKNPMFSGLRLPTVATTSLASSFPKWDRRTLSFISDCLDLAPEKRPTAEALLKHDYFTHDDFPATFLPELRKRVQQEFSTSGRKEFSNTRKSSGENSSVSKRGKNGSPVAVNKPDLGSNKAVLERDSVTRQSVPTITQNSSIPKPIPLQYQNISNYSYNGLSPHNQTTSNVSPQYQSQAHHYPPTKGQNRSQNQVFSFSQSNSKPLSNLTNIHSTNNNANRHGGFALSEASNVFQTNLQISHIPLLKDNKNFMALSPKTSNIPSILSTVSQNDETPSSTTINLDFNASPTFKMRKEEKRNCNLQWSPNTKFAPNMLLRGQNQPKSYIPLSRASPPAKASPGDSQSLMHLNNSNLGSPLSPFRKLGQLDFSRHPYTVSLDRSKDSLVREWPRDSLREIKENKKEYKGDLVSKKQEKEDKKKNKREATQWFKPKLFNEDLCLPNLLAVPGKSTSPPMPLREDSKAEAGRSHGKAKRRSVVMPSIGGPEATSGSSMRFE